MFLLRSAQAEDFKTLQVLGAEIYQQIDNRAFFNWPEANFASELHQSECVVAEQGGQVLSFICYRVLPDNFEITVLGTSLSSRGQGMQKALIEYLQALAARQQRQLLLEVHELNSKALSLYCKMGFIEVNKRRNYYSDRGAALVMSWSAK